LAGFTVATPEEICMIVYITAVTYRMDFAHTVFVVTFVTDVNR
jgi:hypothetical protein